jgi:hypothetical protein
MKPEAVVRRSPRGIEIICQKCGEVLAANLIND